MSLFCVGFGSVLTEAEAFWLPDSLVVFSLDEVLLWLALTFVAEIFNGETWLEGTLVGTDEFDPESAARSNWLGVDVWDWLLGMVKFAHGNVMVPWLQTPVAPMGVPPKLESGIFILVPGILTVTWGSIPVKYTVKPHKEMKRIRKRK